MSSMQELNERAMRLDCGAILNLREYKVDESCGAPSASPCQLQAEDIAMAER
jgi:hypothetical protein